MQFFISFLLVQFCLLYPSSLATGAGGASAGMSAGKSLAKRANPFSHLRPDNFFGLNPREHPGVKPYALCRAGCRKLPKHFGGERWVSLPSIYGLSPTSLSIAKGYINFR